MRYILPFIFLFSVLLACGAQQEHEVVYRVRGTADKVRINYGANGNISQTVESVPWSYRTKIGTGGVATINAQKQGRKGAIEVVIEVDGETVQKSTANGPYALAQASTAIGI